MSLGPMTTYYIRNRYRGSDGRMSSWSKPKSFKTKNEFWQETAMIQKPVSADNTYGRAVAMSGDGNTIASVESGKKKEIFIYTRNGANWILTSTLQTPGDFNYGYDVDLDFDGNVVLIGGFNNRTRSAVFRKENGVWQTPTTLQSPGNGNNFGYSTAISYGGDIIVVGAFSENKTYVYRWNGVAYVLSDTLLRAGVSGLGRSVSISKDGKRIACSSSNNRSCTIFEEVEGDWVETKYIRKPASNNFGISVDISDSGVLLAVGASGEGKVYIYRYIPEQNDWVQQTVLTTNTGRANFGLSVAMSENGLVAIVGMAGAISVQRQLESSWYEQQVLLPSVTPNKTTTFGMSVSVDRQNTSVVAGYHEKSIFVFGL